jgi:tetraacyldisaccharide 4'-kinase
VERLAAPVISIGNISVGGAGKTPFTIALGEELKKRGIRFDVLSRGYGRKTKGTLIVDPNGEPQQFGDEPLLIGRKLGAPVIVSEKRLQAGLVGEREFGSELHLLDDGFQHRSLARDFDIVLVTAQDLEDKLLPAGRLREPASSLARADAIVVTEDLQLPNAASGKPVWRVRREIEVAGVSKPLAFCAIARPHGFFAQLRKAGVEPAVEYAFRDHRAYVESDILMLQRLAEQTGADGFVTTEKDAINMGKLQSRLGKLTVVPLRTIIDKPESVVQTIFAAIENRRA